MATIPTPGQAVLFINGEQVPSPDFELRYVDKWHMDSAHGVARCTRRFIAEWRADPGGVLHRFETMNPVELRTRADGVRRYDLWGDAE